MKKLVLAAAIACIGMGAGVAAACPGMHHDADTNETQTPKTAKTEKKTETPKTAKAADAKKDTAAPPAKKADDAKTTTKPAEANKTTEKKPDKVSIR